MSKITKKDIRELREKLEEKSQVYGLDILALQERISNTRHLIAMLKALEAK